MTNNIALASKRMYISLDISKAICIHFHKYMVTDEKYVQLSANITHSFEGGAKFARGADRYCLLYTSRCV